MKYIVFFLLLVFIVIFKIYTVHETFDTLTKIKKDQAIKEATYSTIINANQKQDIIDNMTAANKTPEEIDSIQNLYLNAEDSSKFSTDFTLKTLVDEGKETEANLIVDALKIGGFYDTSSPETPEQTSTRLAKEAELAEKTDYSKAVNDFDVEYHDSPEKIAKEEGYGLDIGTVWVYDPIQKKKIAIARPKMQNSATYYDPGKYKYGAANYIPEYTESVILSSTNKFFKDEPIPPATNITYYDINSSKTAQLPYTTNGNISYTPLDI